MMRSALLLSAVLCIGNAVVVTAMDGESSGRSVETRYKESSQFERELEGGSGDGISFDDDFWAYDADQSMDVAWTEYSLKPVKCMIL